MTPAAAFPAISARCRKTSCFTVSAAEGSGPQRLSDVLQPPAIERAKRAIGKEPLHVRSPPRAAFAAERGIVEDVHEDVGGVAYVRLGPNLILEMRILALAQRTERVANRESGRFAH